MSTHRPKLFAIGPALLYPAHTAGFVESDSSGGLGTSGRRVVGRDAVRQIQHFPRQNLHLLWPARRASQTIGSHKTATRVLEGCLNGNQSTRSSGEPSGCILEEPMNVRTWALVLIAVSVFVAGSVETLSATGLVVELSPDGRWGPGVHTLAVSGPLQMLGAALLASGRKRRWALSILGCYVFLTGVFGNLPLIFNPNVGGSATAGLLGNLAILGGILYWLHSEGTPSAHRARPALAMTTSATAWPDMLQFCTNSSGPQTPASGQVTRHAVVLARR